MAKRKKNNLIFILFILVGLVIGGIIGEIASEIDSLWWLGYGKQFGFTQPITLDLNIIKMTLSILVKINISSIIGMAIALVAYQKV